MREKILENEADSRFVCRECGYENIYDNVEIGLEFDELLDRERRKQIVRSRKKK